MNKKIIISSALGIAAGAAGTLSSLWKMQPGSSQDIAVGAFGALTLVSFIVFYVFVKAEK